MTEELHTTPRPWYKRKRFAIPLVTLAGLVAAVCAVCGPPLLQPMGKPGRFDDELDRAAAIAMPREGKDAWPALKAACDAFEEILLAETALREQELGRKLLKEETADPSTLLLDPESFESQSPEQVECALVSRRVMNALDAADFWTKLDALAECEHAVQPRQRGVPFLDLTFYQAGYMRGIERFNGARLQLAARSGNGEVVVQSLQRSMDLARLTPPDHGLIASLISLAVQLHATKAIRTEASAGRIDEPTLRSCAEVLDRVKRVPAQRSLAAERVHSLERMETLHTDDGDGDGYLNLDAVRKIAKPGATPSHLWVAAGKFFDTKAQSQTKLRNAFDRAIAAVDGEQSAPSIAESLRTDREALKQRRSVIQALALPELDRFANAVRRGEADVDATRLTLALQRFHAQHARYPATLDELAPTFLAEVPLDRFTMLPFGYQVDNTAEPHTCLLYSVGYDLTDNAAAENPNNVNAALTGDAPGTDFVWARLQSTPAPAAAN